MFNPNNTLTPISASSQVEAFLVSSAALPAVVKFSSCYSPAMSNSFMRVFRSFPVALLSLTTLPRKVEEDWDPVDARMDLSFGPDSLTARQDECVKPCETKNAVSGEAHSLEPTWLRNRGFPSRMAKDLCPQARNRGFRV